MKIIRLTAILYLLFVNYCFAGGDFGNWYAKTPFNNTLNNEYSVIFYSNDSSGKELQHLEKWFFYKTYIAGSYLIGEKINFRFVPHQRKYFVIDEKRDTIVAFESHKQWLKYRNEHKINPLVFTRWHDSDWRFFNTESFFSLGLAVSLLFSLITAVCVIVILASALRVAYRKKFRKSEPLNFVRLIRNPLLCLAGIAVFVMIRILLDIFPQSL